MNTLPCVLDACRGMLVLKAYTSGESELRQLAYNAIYAGGYDGRRGYQRFQKPTGFADTAFVSALIADVQEFEVDADWTVTAYDQDTVQLVADGIRAYVSSDRLCQPPRVGEPAHIRVPMVLPGRIPGFVTKSSQGDVTPPLSRVYLNITPNQASWVLGSLARRLAEADIPYQMKVLAHPGAYFRSDAAVVYVSSARLSDTIATLVQARTEDCVRLQPRVPFMTLAAGPGIGIADEPDDIRAEGFDIPPPSYGVWVADLLTRAALATGTVDALAAEIERAIVRCGRDPLAPHRRGKQSGTRLPNVEHETKRVPIQ